MKRALVGLIFFLIVASSVIAQDNPCTNKLQGLATGPNDEVRFTAVICEGSPVPAQGDTIVIEVGNSQFKATVDAVGSGPPLFVGFSAVSLIAEDPAKAQENLLLLSGAPKATLKFGDKSVAVDILEEDTVKNRFEYEWHVGPATKGDENGDSNSGGGSAARVIAAGAGTGGDDTGGNTGAIRFQYKADYARGGMFGAMDKKSRVQTLATVAIDTTDQNSSDFIDTNRVTGGVQLTNLSFGRLWMHGDVGIEGRLEKAFHHDVHNGDAVVKVAGWVPVLRSFTLFSKDGEFIAPPLSFNASYGYRNRDQEGKSIDGRVFEASALYHLFLFDQYEVDVSGTWTVNDLDDRPVTVPRTQKLYKATISYLASNDKGFKVLTSFENGSAGVMLKEVRQYFIGVALSKLKLGGGL